ncbi:hypothetical protein AAVH_23949 [Aphelenchoides avenae]|nr:hypothetical protein AAVH_23949 [Aphelenchus avenae]
MGPGCDVAPGNRVTDRYYNYAKYLGFKGGNTNKCFQNFVVRCNGYKEGPYKAFVDAAHRYLLQTVSLYGMCLGFDGVQATERTRRIDWLTQNVRALTGEILKAREVFKEAPPTQPPEENDRPQF